MPIRSADACRRPDRASPARSARRKAWRSASSMPARVDLLPGRGYRRRGAKPLPVGLDLPRGRKSGAVHALSRSSSTMPLSFHSPSQHASLLGRCGGLAGPPAATCSVPPCWKTVVTTRGSPLFRAYSSRRLIPGNCACPATRICRGPGQVRGDGGKRNAELHDGFASGQGRADGACWTWELRGVNGKGLDLRLRLPDWIDGLEAGCARGCRGADARQRHRGAEARGGGPGAALRLNEAQLPTCWRRWPDRAAAMDRACRWRPATAADHRGLRGVLTAEARPTRAALSRRCWRISTRRWTSFLEMRAEGGGAARGAERPARRDRAADEGRGQAAEAPPPRDAGRPRATASPGSPATARATRRASRRNWRCSRSRPTSPRRSTACAPMSRRARPAGGRARWAASSIS